MHYSLEYTFFVDDDGSMVDVWIFQEWPTSFCMAIVVMSIHWTSIVELVL